MVKMNKQKIKHDALQATMLVIFVLSVLCIEAESILPFLGIGISAISLALLN
jgi:hypothetical protein